MCGIVGFVGARADMQEILQGMSYVFYLFKYPQNAGPDILTPSNARWVTAI